MISQESTTKDVKLVKFLQCGSRYDFPGVDHEGRQTCRLQIHYSHYFLANCDRKNPCDLVGYLLQPASKRCCATAREGCNLSRAVDDVKFRLLRVQSKRT